MANNRMWLVHRTSGLAVLLGKRMAFGWYVRDAATIGDKMQLLYETVIQSHPGQQDDFSLLMEDTGQAPGAIGEWHYSGTKREDGLTQLLVPDGGRA